MTQSHFKDLSISTQGRASQNLLSSARVKIALYIIDNKKINVLTENQTIQRKLMYTVMNQAIIEGHFKGVEIIQSMKDSLWSNHYVDGVNMNVVVMPKLFGHILPVDLLKMTGFEDWNRILCLKPRVILSSDMENLLIKYDTNKDRYLESSSKKQVFVKLPTIKSFYHSLTDYLIILFGQFFSKKHCCEFIIGHQADNMSTSASLAQCIIFRLVYSDSEHLKWQISSLKSSDIGKPFLTRDLIAKFDADAGYYWSIIKHQIYRENSQPYIITSENIVDKQNDFNKLPVSHKYFIELSNFIRLDNCITLQMSVTDTLYKEAFDCLCKIFLCRPSATPTLSSLLRIDKIQLIQIDEILMLDTKISRFILRCLCLRLYEISEVMVAPWFAMSGCISMLQKNDDERKIVRWHNPKVLGKMIKHSLNALNENNSLKVQVSNVINQEQVGDSKLTLSFYDENKNTLHNVIINIPNKSKFGCFLIINGSMGHHHLRKLPLKYYKHVEKIEKFVLNGYDDKPSEEILNVLNELNWKQYDSFLKQQ